MDRYAFSLGLMAASVPTRGMSGLLRTKRPVIQLLRGLMLVASTASMFATMHFLPLAVYAISFAAPLLVALLSAPLLRERVAPGQWVTILPGFLALSLR